MLGLIFGFVSSIVSGLVGPVTNYLTARKNVEATEFTAMTSQQQADYAELMKAQTSLNQTKVQNNAHGAAAIMVWLFGLPAAIHWAAVFIVASIPRGWTTIVINPAPPVYQDAELKVALSFFVLAPTLFIASSLASRLRG